MRSVLVTGANSGVGLCAVKQLLGRKGNKSCERIVIACRTIEKAEATIEDLRNEFPDSKTLLQPLRVNQCTNTVSSVDELEKLKGGPVDVVILNAGQPGASPAELNKFWATSEMFAVNFVAPCVFGSELLERGLVNKSIIFISSEGASGGKIPGAVEMPTGKTVQQVEQMSSELDQPNHLFSYASAKRFGSLWAISCAKRFPNVRCIALSPGFTFGTGAARHLPMHMYIYMRFIAPWLGIMHSPEDAAKRYLDVATDSHRYKTGTFYASEGKHIGALCDQGERTQCFKDETSQDSVWSFIDAKHEMAIQNL